MKVNIKLCIYFKNKTAALKCCSDMSDKFVNGNKRCSPSSLFDNIVSYLEAIYHTV